MPAGLRHWCRDESGSLTLLSLYFVAIAMIMGGLAIDFANRAAKETKLQTATDAAGHAALLTRVRADSATARIRAAALAANNLPVELHGMAIVAEDIDFGVWDEESALFTPDATARDAVRVSARRNVERNNIVTNLLLQTIGYSGFEVDTTATFQLWEPPCFKNGFMARTEVDIQGNNAFGEHFCMHGDSGVKLSSNNTFAPGAIVSMPDVDDLQLPSSGMQSNDGLQEALRYAYYPFGILRELPGVIAGLAAGDEAYLPGYIRGMGGVALNGKKLSPADFEPGRLHLAQTCAGNQLITFDGGLYSGFVLVTNCKIKFNQGVALENVVIATTNGDAKSLNSPSGLVLGRDDHCVAGGGATLLTLGGFSVASDLSVFGSQVVALGDITFTAQAQGVEGVSMIAGGNVDTTSNIAMNGCPPEGMDTLMTERIVRMVE